jgi:hypothetical protein
MHPQWICQRSWRTSKNATAVGRLLQDARKGGIALGRDHPYPACQTSCVLALASPNNCNLYTDQIRNLSQVCSIHAYLSTANSVYRTLGVHESLRTHNLAQCKISGWPRVDSSLQQSDLPDPGRQRTMAITAFK